MRGVPRSEIVEKGIRKLPETLIRGGEVTNVWVYRDVMFESYIRFKSILYGIKYERVSHAKTRKRVEEGRSLHSVWVTIWLDHPVADSKPITEVCVDVGEGALLFGSDGTPDAEIVTSANMAAIIADEDISGLIDVLRESKQG